MVAFLLIKLPISKIWKREFSVIVTFLQLLPGEKSGKNYKRPIRVPLSMQTFISRK